MIDEKISLRDVEPDDLPRFFEHEQDPAAIDMAAFTPKDPSDHDAFIAHWQRLLQSETSIKRTISLDGDVVGHIASWIQDGNREITYWIDSNHWGKGVATAALRVFVAGVDTRPLYARAAADNIGSIRVLEKCGFVVGGHERGYANARGREIDELVLKLAT
ncbi:MAG: GNAT family N-acetyltransferase [Acidimicrobiia bacterium]|nr:GNAT family N-acetyltransferase [Acidimicrobiia bacterium]